MYKRNYFAMDSKEKDEARNYFADSLSRKFGKFYDDSDSLETIVDKLAEKHIPKTEKAFHSESMTGKLQWLRGYCAGCAGIGGGAMDSVDEPYSPGLAKMGLMNSIDETIEQPEHAIDGHCFTRGESESKASSDALAAMGL